MKTINEIQDEIIEDFSGLEDWMSFISFLQCLLLDYQNSPE